MPHRKSSKSFKVKPSSPMFRSQRDAHIPRNTIVFPSEASIKLNEGYDMAKTIEWIKQTETETKRKVEFIIQDGYARPLIKNADGHDEPLPFNKPLPRNSFNYAILPMAKEIARQTGVSASAIYREFIENTTGDTPDFNVRNHKGFWKTAMELMGLPASAPMTVVAHRPQPDAYLGGCYANALREHKRTGSKIVIGAQFNSFGNSLCSLSPHAVNQDIHTEEIYDTATNDYIARAGKTRLFIPLMSSIESKAWVEAMLSKRPHADLGETIGYYELITQGDSLFVLPSFEPKRGVTDLSDAHWGKVKTIDLRTIPEDEDWRNVGVWSEDGSSASTVSSDMD